MGSSFFLCSAINTWSPSAPSLILSSLVNGSSGLETQLCFQVLAKPLQPGL